MPTIKRLNRCRLEMYFADHGMPHFHVIGNDNRRASVAIETLEVLAGEVAQTALSEAIEWARSHPFELRAKWKEFSE